MCRSLKTEKNLQQDLSDWGIKGRLATLIRCCKHSFSFRRSTWPFKLYVAPYLTCVMNVSAKLDPTIPRNGNLSLASQVRECVYQFRPDACGGGDPEQSQPLQLQRLFAALQLSDRAAADTRPLTRFTWLHASKTCCVLLGSSATLLQWSREGQRGARCDRRG